MATPFSCKGEAYSSGGPGIFLLGRAEALSQTLAAEYEGSVTLIYLDMKTPRLIQFNYLSADFAA